jgi:hypothetical protein
MAWLPITDLGKGLNLDATPEELEQGATTGGKNIRFRAGYAERFRGLDGVFTTPAITPYSICHFTLGSTRYVVYAGLAKTYADDGSTRTEITNADNSGAINDRMIGCVFNGVYVQNNGVNVPQYWDGNAANNLVDLPAWPSGYKAGFLRPFKNYLVAGDITKGTTRYRQLVLTSHLADPGTLPTSWDVTDPTKDAVEQPLAETDGTLIDLLPLGDLGVLYKDDAVHFMQTVTNGNIFRFGRLPGDTGMLSRGCGVQIPGAHVLLTPGLDVVTFDGQTMQSVLDGRMRTWLQNNMNQSYASRSFLCVNPLTTEVLVCFPADAAEVCTKALIWNYKDNTFAVRDLSNVTFGSTGEVDLSDADSWDTAVGTWDTDTTAWSDGAAVSGVSRLILTSTAPKLLMFDSSEQDSGSSFTATLEKIGLHFDQPEVVKLCRAVRPKIDAAAGTVVKVQIGSAMVPDADPTWQAAQDFTVGTDIEVHSFATGRFLSVRLYTTGDTFWRLRSLQMDVVPQGAY